MEHILCAAVRDRNDPKIFYCGYRHDTIYSQFGEDKLGMDFYNDMGFLTSEGRFVGRREAKQIATTAKQIVVGYADKYDFLATEMLY